MEKEKEKGSLFGSKVPSNTGGLFSKPSDPPKPGAPAAGGLGFLASGNSSSANPAKSSLFGGAAKVESPIMPKSPDSSHKQASEPNPFLKPATASANPFLGGGSKSNNPFLNAGGASGGDSGQGSRVKLTFGSS